MRELSDKELADYLAGLSDRLWNPLVHGTYRSHYWDTGFRFPNGPDYRPCQDDIIVLRQAIERLRQMEMAL